MNIQQYRKAIDKRFKKTVPILPPQQLMPNAGELFSPNTHQGVALTEAEFTEMRNRYKDLARYNSRNQFGVFYDTATDTYVPMTELTRDRVFAGEDQYQIYNREKNKRYAGETPSGIDIEDIKTDQYLYPHYDPEISRADGGKGAWIMAAGAPGKSMRRMQKEGLDVYNVFSETPQDRSIFGNMATGFWNGTQMLTTAPIQTLNWATNLTTATWNFLTDPHNMSAMVKKIPRMTSMGGFASIVANMIANKDGEFDYSKFKSSERDINKSAAMWREMMNRFKLPSSQAVLDNPHGMEAFEEALGQGLASVLEYGVLSGAPANALASVGMREGIAYTVGAAPASMVLTGSESTEAAIEAGLNKEEAALFSLGYTVLASAVELSGANALNRYLVGMGGRNKVLTNAMAKELNLEEGALTGRIVKDATKNAFRNVYNDFKKFRKAGGFKLKNYNVLGRAWEEGREEGAQNAILTLGEYIHDTYVADRDALVGEGRFRKYYDGSQIMKDIYFDAAVGSAMGGLGAAMATLSYRNERNATLANYVAANQGKRVMDESNDLLQAGIITPEQYQEVKNRITLLEGLKQNNKDLFRGFQDPEFYKDNVGKALAILSGNVDFIQDASDRIQEYSQYEGFDLEAFASDPVYASAFNKLAIDNVIIGNSANFAAQLKEAGLEVFIPQIQEVEKLYRNMPKEMRDPIYESIVRNVLENIHLSKEVNKLTLDLQSKLDGAVEDILSTNSKVSPEITKNTLDLIIKQRRLAELDSLLSSNRKSLKEEHEKASNAGIPLNTYFDNTLNKLNKYIKEQQLLLEKEITKLKDDGVLPNTASSEALNGIDPKDLIRDIESNKLKKVSLDASIDFFYNKKNRQATMEEIQKEAEKRKKAEEERKKEEEEVKKNKPSNSGNRKTSKTGKTTKTTKKDGNVPPGAYGESSADDAAERIRKLREALNDPFLEEGEREDIEDSLNTLLGNNTEPSVANLMGPNATRNSINETYAEEQMKELEKENLQKSDHIDFGKTSILNVAFLHNQYEIVVDKNGVTKFVTKYNEDGSIKEEDNADRRLSLPTFMSKNSRVVLYVDTSHADYEQYKNDLSKVPIAIQTIEDYEAKKTPTSFLHRLDWVAEHDDSFNISTYKDGSPKNKGVSTKAAINVFNYTKEIRTTLFHSEFSPSPIFETNVISKGIGVINHSKNYVNVSELLNKDPRLFIAIGAIDDFKTTPELLKKIPERLTYRRIKGIPYVFFPAADGTYQMSQLKQYELGETPELHEKYANIITDLIYDFIGDQKLTKNWSVTQLKKTIGLYVYASETTKKGLKSPEKAEALDIISELEEAAAYSTEVRKDLIFNMFKDLQNNFLVNLPSNRSLFATYKVETIKNDDGTERKAFYTTYVEGNNLISEKELTKDQFKAILKEGISKKYPNIVMSRQEIAEENQEFLDYTDKGLTVVKGGLSEFMEKFPIAYTNIQPIEASGTLTYTSQPNIGISHKIKPLGAESTSEPVVPTKSNEKTKSANPFAKTSKSKVGKVKLSKPSKGSTNTAELINFTKELSVPDIAAFSAIESLAEEQEMVKYLTKRMLDMKKLLYKPEYSTKHLEKIAELRLLDELQTTAEDYLKKADAIEKTDKETAEEYRNIASNHKLIIDHFESGFYEDLGKVFIGYKTRIALEMETLNFNMDYEESLEEEEVFMEANYDNASANLKRDYEKSAAGRIRRFLYFIDIPTGAVNMLNQPISLDYSSIFNYLVSALADVPIEKMEEAFKDLVQTEFNLLESMEEASEEEELNLPLKNEVHDIIEEKPYSQTGLPIGTVYMIDNALEDEDSKDGSFKREFFKVLRKHRNILLVQNFYPGKKGHTDGQFKVMKSNTRGTVNVVINKWRNNFYNRGLENGLIKLNPVTGIYEINKDKAKRIAKQFNNIFVFKDKYTTLQTRKQIVAALNYIGIDMTMQTLNTIFHERRYKRTLYKNTFKDDDSITFDKFLERHLGKIFNSFISTSAEEEGEESFKTNNPFYKQHQLLGAFAKYYLRENPMILSDSFKNASNETVYGFSEHSYLTDRVDRFTQEDPDFINKKKQSIFAKRSYWLSLLSDKERREDFLYNFEYGIFDASKNVKNYERAVKITEQSPREFEATRLNLFLNNNHEKNAYYLYIIPSDKSSIPIFKAPKIKSKATKIVQDHKINLKKSEYIKILYETVVLSELDRINQVKREFRNTSPENRAKNLISGYHYEGNDVGLGAKFVLIPELNNIVHNDLHEDLQLDAKAVKEFLASYFEEMINDRVSTWEELGIFNKEESRTYIDFRAMRAAMAKVSSSSESWEDAIKYTAAEYVMNYAIAYSNMLQLFNGDPALFAKLKKGWNGIVGGTKDATIANVIKRTAKDIAPGPEGVWEGISESANYIFAKPGSVNVDARNYTSLISSYMAGPAYQNIDHTDGVEYITASEYINNLYAYGKISEQVWKRSIDALSKGKDLLLKDLGQVLNPLKQVYVDSEIYDIILDNGEQTNFERNQYIKSSSVPLIPQLTRQFPQLDNLRKNLERSSVDRLAFVGGSSSKFSMPNAVEVFDENGNFKDFTIDNSQIVSLSRRGLRIQQETPYKPTKKEIIHGSQLAVLQFADLPVSHNIEYHGHNTNGHELYKFDGNIQATLFKRKFNRLLTKLGIENRIVETESGEPIEIFTPKSLEKLKRILIDEAVSRKGYTYNDLLTLTVLIDQDTLRENFEIPLYFHQAVNKIEALLNSLINNNVLQRKLPGKSYIQEPSAGYFNGKVATEAFAEDFLKNGVILTKEYDPITGLKYKETEEGIVAEVFMPFMFKNQEDNPLDITPYIKDGYLDTSKIDKELLTLIGYRIPTQGFNSMIKLKVVGFLPEIAGDLIIVPPEIGRQSGSDYDIDKLFTHFFNYNLEEETGNLTKISVDAKSITEHKNSLTDYTDKELQNMLLDITHSILGSGNLIYEKQLETLDNDELAKAGDHIDELEAAANHPTRAASLLDLELQYKYLEQGSAGKMGIAVASMFSVNHVNRQHANIYVGDIITPDSITRVDTIQFKDEHGNLFEDSLFSPDIINNRVNELPDAFRNALLDGKAIPAKASPYSPPEKGGAWRLDKVYGFTGKLISKVIKNIQNASVDNAGNPQMHKLFLNSETMNLALYIAGVGFDERFIAAFLRQPVIKQYVYAKRDSKGYLRTDFDANAAIAYENDILKKAGLENLDDLEVTPFSLKELEDFIQYGANDTEKAQLLVNYIKWSKVASKISDVQVAFNTVSKKLGKSIYSTIYKREQVELLGKDFSYIKNVSNLLHDESVLGAVYQYAVKYGSLLYNDRTLLPIKSKALSGKHGVLTYIANTMGKTTMMDENTVNTIMTDVRNAIYSSLVPLAFNQFEDYNGKSMAEIRQFLLYGENSVARRLLKAKTNINNALVKILEPNLAEDTGFPDVIEYFANKGIDDTNILQLQLAWVDLWNSKNQEEHKLARDLVSYVFTVGNERNARDFGRFIPIDLLRALNIPLFLDQIDFHHSAGLTKLLMENFSRQWFQHYPFRTMRVNMRDIDKFILKNNEEAYSIDNPITKFYLTDIDAKDSRTSRLLVKDGFGGEDFPDYLSLFDKKSNRIFLYEKDVSQAILNRYNLIPTAGNKKQLVKEFDLHTENLQSVIRDNYAENKKKDEKKKTDAEVAKYNRELRALETGLLRKYSPQQREVRKTGTAILDKLGREKGVEKVLKNIAKNGSFVEYKAWAKFLLDKQKRVNLDKWRIEAYNMDNPLHWSDKPLEDEYATHVERERALAGDLQGRVNIKEKLILINPDVVNSKEHAEHVFLHEVLHTYLKYLLDNYELLTKEEKASVNSLRAVIAKLRNDSDFLESISEDTIENQEIKYGLGIHPNSPMALNSSSVVSEFISVLGSNVKLQRMLNEKVFSGKKTILDRVWEALLKFFGLNVKRNSVLARSLSDVYILLDNDNSIKRINKGLRKENLNKKGNNTPAIVAEPTFENAKNPGYPERTRKNASADATIAIAVNFESPGEKLTKKSVKEQGKLYLPVSIEKSLTIPSIIVDAIVDKLNKANASTLNIAGNSALTLKDKYTQAEVDNYAYELLGKIITHPSLKNPITHIRTGGQTGMDEAGTKAAMRLGIPNLVYAPADWRMLTVNGATVQGPNNEGRFKNRFKNVTPDTRFQITRNTEEKPSKPIVPTSNKVKAKVSQELVSGTPKYGTLQEATPEIKKVLGANPHSIDMIEAGFRTRTTRSASFMQDSQLKVGDIIEHVGTSSDGSTKHIKAVITAIYPKGTKEYYSTWNKEGWTEEGVAHIKRFKSGAAAIEFELLDNKKIKPTSKKTINIYSSDKNGYEDLSNFEKRPFKPTMTSLFPPVTFKSVESAFQFAKMNYADMISDQPREVQLFLNNPDNYTSSQARRIGKQIKGLRIEEWDKNAPIIMHNLMKDSFEQNPEALQKLLSTGNAILTHNQDKGKWKTLFPKILMKVREELEGKIYKTADLTAHTKREFSEQHLKRAYRESSIISKIGTMEEYIGYRSSELHENSEPNSPTDITNFGIYVTNLDTKNDLDNIEKRLTTTANLINTKRTSSRLIADNKREFLKILYNKLSQKGSNKTELVVRIERMRQQIQYLEVLDNDLRLQKTLVEDLNSAREIIKIVDANIENTKVFTDASELLEKLSIAGNYLDTWEDVSSMFNYTSPKLINEVNSLSTDLERLKKFKLETNKKSILHIANNFSYTNGFTEDNLFKGQRDENVIKAVSLSTRHSSVDLVKVAHSLLGDMTTKANEEYYFKQAEIKNKVKELEKATGLTGTSLWNNFLQFRKGGEWTGQYLAKYSQEYYDETARLRDEAKKAGKWNKYWSFVRSNTKPVSEDMVKGKKRGDWSKEQFEKQKALYKEYLDALEAFKDNLATNTSIFDENGEFINKSAQREYSSLINSWQNKYSPVLFLRARNGDIRFKKGMKGSKYLVSFEPTDKWIDPRYTKMRNNKAMSSFYDYMLDILKENRDILPTSRVRLGNYLPELSKTAAEQFKDGNYNKLFGDLADGIKNSLIVQADNLIDYEAQLGGKLIKFVPIHMMNNVLPTGKKSKDIQRILLAQSSLSIGYKHKSQTLPVLDAIVNMLSVMKEGDRVQVGSTFIPKENKYGEILENPKDLTNARKHLEDTMKALIYEDYKNKNTAFKRYTAEEQERVDVIKEALNDPELNDEDRMELLTELSTLGKETNINAISDGLITYTYTLGLSFPNIASPATNLTFGVISNFTYAAGGKYVSSKNLMKGTTMMMGAISRRATAKMDNENLSKIYGFMDRFGLLSNIVEVNYGGVKTIANKLVILQSKTEYINQGSLVIGILKTMTMKDKNGDKISLWDAFTLNESGALIVDTSKVDNTEKVPSDQLLSDDEKSINTIKLTRIINSIVAEVHGDYESIMTGKRMAWFRHVSLFKTWIPETINHRFGKLELNPDTGEWEKGRYLSWVSSTDKKGSNIAMGKSLLDSILNLYRLTPSNGFQEYSELDRRNLARNVREMQFILLITGAALLMKLLADGSKPDDESVKIVRLMLNIVNKSRADLMFFLNPKSALNVFNNIVPTVSALAKAASAVDVAYDLLTGDSEITTGPLKGKNKALRWSLEVTPGGSGFVKMGNAMNRVYRTN